jgi:long-chain fatty acid transport protein
MTTTRVTPLLLAVSAALPFAAAAQTTGYLLPCSAAAPLARGCTLLSATGEPATMLGNPAGLASLAGPALSLAGSAFMPTMDYANSVNPRVSGQDNTYMLPAVFIADRARGRFTFGLGAQTLGGMGADYRLTHALLGADQTYHSRFGLMKAAAAAAMTLTDQLALGGSFGALYGQLEFATPYSMNPLAFAGMAGLAQDPDYAPLFGGFTEMTAYADMRSLSGFAVSGSASVEYRPSRRVTLAASYVPRSTLTMSGGTAAMNMNAQFAQLYQALVAAKDGDDAMVNAQLDAFGIDMSTGMATAFDAEVDFGVPATATLALGVRPNDRWGLGLDLGWIGYERGFQYMDVRMRNGTNRNINILMNGDPSNGAFDAGWPLEWKDAWVARLGGEWQAPQQLVARAGVMYGTNPVPDNTLFTIFPAVVETALSGGLAYRAGSVTASLTYAHALRRGQTAATPHMVACEYEGSTSRLAEDMIAVGLTWRP